MLQLIILLLLNCIMAVTKKKYGLDKFLDKLEEDKQKDCHKTYGVVMRWSRCKLGAHKRSANCAGQDPK